MAKKVEVELDIKGSDKVKGLGQEIRELTKQLRQTPEGTKEWSQIYNKIDDLKDKLASSKKASMDWIDTLENAGGPLGMLGKALNQVKVATQSWGAALKATGIGLLVSLIGGLVAAFSQTEGSMKKLQPLMIGLEKIFGGIVQAMQPMLDMILELGMKALPYVTQGFKYTYAAVAALFTYIKNMGAGIVKVWKGIFTFDWKTIKEGVSDMGESFGKTADAFNQALTDFDKGAAKQTKTQKENAKNAKEIADKALQDKIKHMEAQDKLDAAQMEKMKQEALALATTEQQKLDVEKAFAKKSYEQQIKDIEDKQLLYKKDSDEYKNLQAEKLKIEGDYIKQTEDFKTKQKEITDKHNKELMDSEISALDLKKANGQIKEYEYQEALYNIKKKYLTDKKELDANEVAFAQAKFNEKKRLSTEERQLLFQSLQNEIDLLDRKNARYDNDFAQDQARMEQKKKDVEAQRELELQAAEGDAAKQLEIRKKYADQLYNIDVEITNNKKAQHQAQIELENMYVDTIGQFGQMLEQIAGKNKKLAIAGILITQAAGVAKTIINTQEAASNIAKTSTLGYLDPRAILTYVQGGISVITSIAAAKKGIDQINGGNESSAGSAPVNAGNSAAALGNNYGDGGMIDGPRHAQGGVMINAEGGEAVMTRGAVTMFAPLLSTLNQMGGGTSFSKGAVGQASYDSPSSSASTEPQIIKTYVVENELTSIQHRQARLKDLSTL